MNLTKVYPLNIAMKIFNNEEYVKKIYIAGLLEEISKLDKRQCRILKMRFKEHKTLKECGTILEIGSERVRQLQAIALNTLKNPKHLNAYLAISKLELNNEIAKYKNISLKYLELQKTLELLSNYNLELDIEEIKNISELVALLNKPIEYLDLSPRVYTSLKKANKTTIKDLIKTTSKEYLKINSFGVNSLNVIRITLKQHGLKIKGE